MVAAILGCSFLAQGATSQAGSSTLPSSFIYNGQKSSDFLSGWKLTVQTKLLDVNRIEKTTTRRDPTTGLQVRIVEIEYIDSLAKEWTVYLKNTGKQDTPIIENLQALDMAFPASTQDQIVLHHNVGSPANGTDYDPIETPLPLGSSKVISGAGGRPTNSDLSYFNLSWGNHGEIIVVGWPGQWEASFSRTPTGSVRVTAGQQLTHFKLHPGEEVRTPLIVTLPWTEDWIHGQNLWRHWMMAYGMPKPGGKLPQQMMEGYSGRVTHEMIDANETNQIMFIDRYLEEHFQLDYWWMDAGWYIQTRGWPQVGTWEVDTKRFPNGLKPISDHAHQRGVKTMVWFEPERVAADTWLANNHPEWLLGDVSPLVARRSSQLGTQEPWVMANTSDRDVNWHGIHWSPHRLSFHPGPHGEYSVVRFTAPRAGTYSVKSAFAAIDPLATTDVHVLQSGKSLFNWMINLKGFGDHEDFTGTVQLAAGDPVDFVVGFGAGRFNNDSTGLDAVLTADDGTAYDAARQYGAGGAWSYGYLAPGATPDASTFRAYDRTEPGLPNEDRLLNLGNPTARNWLVDHIDKLLTDNGIDLYRQDFNMDPLDDWRGNDATDRQGITENKYIVGYLAYWDELRHRHPNMLIDSCASGGRRNDLETMRRAVPLWRSDMPFVPTAHQGMTYGLAMWLPYFGTGQVANGGAPYYGEGVMPVIPYDFWSVACPSNVSEIDIRQKGYDYDTLRRLWGEWRELGADYYGDFYPLTPFSTKNDVWLAWQFNSPEKGEGFIQAFRRPDASNETVNLKLSGLDPQARYRLSGVEGDALSSTELSGQQLMTDGLPVFLHARPGACVIKYRRM